MYIQVLAILCPWHLLEKSLLKNLQSHKSLIQCFWGLPVLCVFIPFTPGTAQIGPLLQLHFCSVGVGQGEVSDILFSKSVASLWQPLLAAAWASGTLKISAPSFVCTRINTLQVTEEACQTSCGNTCASHKNATDMPAESSGEPNHTTECPGSRTIHSSDAPSTHRVELLRCQELDWTVHKTVPGCPMIPLLRLSSSSQALCLAICRSASCCNSREPLIGASALRGGEGERGSRTPRALPGGASSCGDASRALMGPRAS